MRILVGYDGSASATAAILDLAHAGLPDKAEARVLMVIRPWVPPPVMQALSDAPGWYSAASMENRADTEAAETEALKIIGKARDLLLASFPQWTVEPASTIASPVHGLLDMSTVWKPDLIVLGSHGRGRMGGLPLGSVARRVLEHASYPVRIGRLRQDRLSGPPRLLIGLDGSTEAAENLDAVSKRPWPPGTEAMLLSVMDFPLSLAGTFVNYRRSVRKSASGPGWPWMEKTQGEARTTLEHSGLQVSTAILEGAATQVLLKEAERFRADNIFLGSRGLGGLGRLFLGSVSFSVAMRARCSVEVHRRKPGEKEIQNGHRNQGR